MRGKTFHDARFCEILATKCCERGCNASYGNYDGHVAEHYYKPKTIHHVMCMVGLKRDIVLGTDCGTSYKITFSQ